MDKVLKTIGSQLVNLCLAPQYLVRGEIHTFQSLSYILYNFFNCIFLMMAHTNYNIQ
jgi:hypothetical protein